MPVLFSVSHVFATVIDSVLISCDDDFNTGPLGDPVQLPNVLDGSQAMPLPLL